MKKAPRHRRSALATTTPPPPSAQRRALLQTGTLVLLLGAQQIARGATIVAVRVWPAADYTRVTIESDGRLQTQQRVVGSPPRLALDIEGIDLSPALRELVGKIKPGDPYINGLRVGQNAPGVVRIVFDLKQSVAPQVFSLAPVAAYRHRLVLDLYPQQELDPMEALIAERLRDAPKALGTDSVAAGIAPNNAAPTGETPTPPRPAPPAVDSLGELMAQQSMRPLPAPVPPMAGERMPPPPTLFVPPPLPPVAGGAPLRP
ncbi:MAG: cell wall hydrolase/autolysin, partial [Variovorax sp.]|nr:cell wall hydrolase/autolysin [Variovorax sp.]